MPRPLATHRRGVRVIVLALAALAIAAITAACGEERISVPKSSPYYEGAVLFSQRCAGCHTINAAATEGSPRNITDATDISGPNFNQRCERPVARVLYAIENGGFSGAYMPQNIVVGQQAREVAEFVAHYAGSQTVYQPGSGLPRCKDIPIGTLPPLPTVAGTGSSTTSTVASAGS